MICMKIKLLAGVIVAVLIAVGGVALLGTHRGIPNAPISTSIGSSQVVGTPAAGQPGPNSSKTLFASTQYAPYAYVVYPNPISQQAQAALAGFNLTTATLQNGSVGVTLTITGTNQHQSLTLKPNYRLYIIETTFGDDGFHFDSSFGDDGFVVVDQNGYLA